MNSEYTKITFF